MSRNWWSLGRTVSTLVALSVLSLMQAAHAQYRNSWQPTTLELTQLPPFCQGQFRPELTKDPAYRFPTECGEFFNHFCPGLVAMSRASDPAMLRADRKVMFSEFVDHLQYTVKHMRPQCPMAPQVEVMKLRRKFLETALK